MQTYLELIYVFTKIGAFTFGGGYAMLPLLQKEIVDNKHWATEEELMDYFAVGQCTPGVIAVNTATFIGYNLKGIPGGIIATLAVIFPSIVIILLIASLLNNFSELAIVQHALGGIRIAVCILILNAILKLFKSGVKDSYGVLIFVCMLMATTFNIIPTILIVLISGICGILIRLWKIKKGGPSL